MSTFEDIEEFRKSEQAQNFADEWIAEERTENPAGDKHMSLLIWQRHHPHQALGIILSLLEKADSDEQTFEMIALGSVEKIIEMSGEAFAPFIRDAADKHPLFALCTRERRQFFGWPIWSPPKPMP